LSEKEVSTKKSVEEYIENAPKEFEPKLKELRSAIRQAAPDAIESISYGMPFYSFKGESGFNARLCYFGFLKSKKKIVFYTRPVYLEEYMDAAKKYSSAKSALQFSLEEPTPIQLIKRIVRNGVRKHRKAA
jgi:uncharacterized protein YdhG (YjbR/CyaY superfamily)